MDNISVTMPAFVQSSPPCCCEPMKWYLHSGPMTLEHSACAIGNSLVLNLPQGQQLNCQNSRTDYSYNAQYASVIIIMSRVCNDSTDQSDRRTNAARFCDLTCTLDLWTGTCSASTDWFKPCDIANFRSRADICHLAWLKPARGKVFVVFFSFQIEKVSLRVLFFRGLPVQVEFRFHDDTTQSLLVAGAVWLHLGPPRQPSGCCGRLSLSHTAPAARRDCIFTPQPCVLGQSVRVDFSKSVSTSPQTQALITTRSTAVEQIRSGKSLGSTRRG